MPDPNETCPATYVERYGDEWKDPDVASCAGGPTLTFNGTTLKLHVSDKVSLSYKADSGKPTGTDTTGQPVFDYSKERQTLTSQGPIPEGSYWINPNEIGYNWGGVFRRTTRWSQSAWGSYRVTIHPARKTNTHCRGGFFIHGGRDRGSSGCIDLTSNIEQFAADLKKYTGGGACSVPLQVIYS